MCSGVERGGEGRLKSSEGGGGGLNSGEGAKICARSGGAGGGDLGISLFFYTGLKGPTGTYIGVRSPAALSRKKQSRLILNKKW